jgi:tetratricopeptide (TPR) repeat protein
MAILALTMLLLAQADFEPLYRRALEDRLRTLGHDAAKTRQSARDLGLYLAMRGEFEKAQPYIEPAIDLADSPQGAAALHNWAVAVEERDGALAERMYRKALAIRVQALPALDPELATTRLNLAALLLTRGEAQAGRLASQALAAFEKRLGPADARTGAACGVLGAALATRGDVSGAERLFRRALAIAEKAHGPLAPETANALENLADLFSQTNRKSAARPLLDRAQRIRGRAR